MLRGRVLTPSGQGLRGVRVSNGLALREGFTLTRSDGYFDILLTAARVIKLKFGKSPFPYQSKSIFVPQNQVKISNLYYHNKTFDFKVVVMDDIYLKLKKERTGRNLNQETFCEDHLSHISRPTFETIDATNSKAFLNEEVDLFPSELYLHYNSEKQESYAALINISLVDKMPKSLLKVFTRISVEGNVYEREYEAENNLNTIFKWDGYNVYGQKHYGNAVVTIKVGYRYKLCHNIVWSSHNMIIHAHTPQSTAIGGWNLNIHHVYNKIDGIIYKGNGDIEDMKTHEKKVTVLNEQFSKTIISPVAIVAAPDDNLYVGDLKFIRKIDINNKVTSLPQLSESTVSHKYYMDVTVGFRKYLILLDPVNKRILKVPTEIKPGKNVENNFEILVGIQIANFMRSIVAMKGKIHSNKVQSIQKECPLLLTMNSSS